MAATINQIDVPIKQRQANFAPSSAGITTREESVDSTTLLVENAQQWSIVGRQLC
jgi:hypothetical protein